MKKNIRFVKEIVVNYLWMVSVKKFCLGALGSSCPTVSGHFYFTAMAESWRYFVCKYIGSGHLLVSRKKTKQDILIFIGLFLFSLPYVSSKTCFFLLSFLLVKP